MLEIKLPHQLHYLQTQMYKGMLKLMVDSDYPKQLLLSSFFYSLFLRFLIQKMFCFLLLFIIDEIMEFSGMPFMSKQVCQLLQNQKNDFIYCYDCIEVLKHENDLLTVFALIFSLGKAQYNCTSQEFPYYLLCSEIR